VDLIVDTIAKLEKENIKSVEAEKSAEDDWTEYVARMADKTLFPKTRYSQFIPLETPIPFYSPNLSNYQLFTYVLSSF
jgi:hypothetical protein